jgi:menaquinone-specific isochorismate synthase
MKKGLINGGGELVSSQRENLLQIQGQDYPYQHLAIEIPPVKISTWLRNQSLFPKVCWIEKGGKVQRVALGNLLSFPTIPQLSAESHPEIRFYGGKQFGSGAIDSIWHPFPPCAFWLPRFEIVQEEGHAVLHIHFIDEDANPQVMKELCFEEKNGCDELALLREREDFPRFPQWEAILTQALEHVEQGKLEKIVLARKTTFFADDLIDPYSMLHNLENLASNATIFLLQPTPDAAFLGATPETLYQRVGSSLFADAIAGTRARGKTPDEDLELAEELLQSVKEQHEFECVKDFIETALDPLCEEIEWNNRDQILRLPNVQHIYNRIKAILKNGVSDHDLMATLHPTPALGGKPRAASLALLAELEPFQRGWYGAPIGYLSSQAADIAVAIRSALVRGKEIDLFAGTGIVKGSHPAQEWDELEQKIATFTRIFL